MTNKVYDVAIIGGGVAGVFAAMKLSKVSGVKCIMFDLGRPSGKRRRQLEGWFGVLPNSDGKLYMNDVQKVSGLTGNRKAKSASTWVTNYLSSVIDYDIKKDRELYVGLDKKIKKNGFEYHLNDHIQLFPKEIHALSKDAAQRIEQSGNVTFSFDNEVFKVFKQKGNFLITTAQGEFSCKKLLLCVGRSGWRWTADIFNNFGIIDSNDIATFGIHAEISCSYMKDFNKSNCTITKGDLEIGPLTWNGTIIPEDHVDLAISAFRSNENRWKSEKVSFQIIGHRRFENAGYEQTSRLGKLAFVLSNDRILRERISTLMSGKSKISIIPEYSWLGSACEEIGTIMPDFLSKGYFHIPTIMPLPPKIQIGDNLSTEVDNLFVAGESAGIPGLMSAALSGVVAAENMLK